MLVTGGAGFIGSHVAEYLLRRGDDVVIMDEVRLSIFPGRSLHLTGDSVAGERLLRRANQTSEPGAPEERMGRPRHRI